MKRNWIPWGVILVATVLFIALVKYEDRAVVRTIDFATTVKVQERIDKSSRLRLAAFVETIMEGATFFASPEFTVALTVAVTGFCAYRTRKKAWGTGSLIIPIVLGFLVLLEIYIKSTIHHPSPPFSMIKNPTTMFAKDYINEQFSFPSGHAARAMFLAWISYAALRLTQAQSKRHIIAFLFLTMYVLVVSVSLVYLGHHWLSDVVGGLLIGTSCGAVIMLWFARARHNDLALSAKPTRDAKKA